MSDKDPIVTVCIATHGRAEILPYAICSVLEQSLESFEVIIVDDCSPDNTPQVVRKHEELDKRIRYIRHETNLGLAAARNTAIRSAKGTFFTFLDDDDQWEATFLEEFVTLAGKYDDTWCFTCGTKHTNRIGITEYKTPKIHGSLKDYCRQGYTPSVASQFYYTSTLRRCGGYNEEIRSGVDHDLWLRLAFCNINITSLEKCLALPDSVPYVSRVRMTNQYEKRITGIKNSLEHWKPDIVREWGETIYEEFYKAYVRREKKKFFYTYVMELKIGKALQVYSEIKEAVSLRNFVVLIGKTFLYTLSISMDKNKFSIKGPTLEIPS